MRSGLFALIVLSSLIFADSPVIEITSSPVTITVNASDDKAFRYITTSGNVFQVIETYEDSFTIQLPNGELGQLDQQFTRPLTETVSDEELQNAFITRVEEEIIEPYVEEEPEVYIFPGQENFRYPRRARNKNLNIDVNGFYEVKVSGRDYSPNDPTDPRWEKIINDEAYRKIPRNVLIGPAKLDITYDIEIDGKLNDDLSLSYDIEQEPDLPGKYDVEVEYKDKKLSFFDLDVDFQHGEYINVKKAIRGASYEQDSESQDVLIAIGNERSKPLTYENFGNGQKTIKLGRSNVLEGSETVYLNNKKLSKGDIEQNGDYDIDYFSGVVTFRIAPQVTDFIKVVYEFTNPIEDFLPSLTRKNFFGWQYLWESEDKVIVRKKISSSTDTLWNGKKRKPRSTDSYEDIIRAMIEREDTSSNQEPSSDMTEIISFFQEEQNQQHDIAVDAIPSTFSVTNTPIILGSDNMYLNDILLIRNEDYFLDHSDGFIQMRVPLNTNDVLKIRYDYYNNTFHTEDLIARNSVGPYRLSNKPIIDGTVTVQLDGNPVIEALDYILDYDEGKLYFNYEIEKPTIISVQYRAIDTEIIQKASTEKPLAIGVTYLKESSKSREDELEIDVASENVTVTNNLFTVSNNPIINTEDIKVYANGFELSSAGYTITDAYTGEIELNSYSGGDVYVDYTYGKSFSTKETIRLKNTDNDYTYTNADDDFFLNNIPVKYEGFEYIEYNYNGVTYRLNDDIDFDVTYSDGGNTISIEFLADEQGSLFNTSGLNIPPPEGGDVLILHFDYTSSSSDDPGDIEQRMYGLTLSSQLTDKWSVNTEFVGADHNFSKARLSDEKTFTGTGVDNQVYSLNHSNLVENTEQVFINDELMQKDEDYIINYVRGEVKFRNQTPSSEDSIVISYEYFDNSTTQAGDRADFKIATKLNTSYKGEDVQANGYFKYIDLDFLALSPINEAEGSTVFGGNFDWEISPEDQMKISYDRKRTDQGPKDDNTRAYKTRNDFTIDLKNKAFNTIDLDNGMEYILEIDDPKSAVSSGNRRATDKATYRFNTSVGFGPNTQRTTYRRSFSRSIDDYIDRYNVKNNIVETNAYTHRYSTSSIPWIHQFSLSPHYSNSITDTTEELTDKFSTTTRQTYGASNAITPIKNLNFSSSYTFSDIETISSSASKNLQETLNYILGTRYTPSPWFDFNWRYSQTEKETPLQNQRGSINFSNSYSIGKFAPEGFLVASGLSHTHPITKAFNDSIMSFSYKETDSLLDDHRKHNNNINTNYSFRSFKPFTGVALESLTITARDISNINLVETTSVSENRSSQLSYGTSGRFSIRPQAPILELFDYSHVFNIRQDDTTITQLARSSTTNITVKEKPVFDRTQILNFKPPTMAIPLPFKRRLPLGAMSFQLSEFRNEETNRETESFYFEDTDRIIASDNIEEDSKYTTRYKASVSLTPFNLFSTNASISTENYLYRRNFSSSQGTTIRNKLDQNIGVSYSPFSWLQLDGSYSENNSIQYYSPSITASVEEIIDARGNMSQESLTNYLEKNIDNVSLRGNLKPFRFIAFNGGYSIKNIDQLEEKLSNGTEVITSSNFIENTLSYGSTLKLFKGFTANMTYSEHFTESDGTTTEGFSRDLTVTYKPFERKNFKVSIVYKQRDEWGPLLNFSDIIEDEQGSGDDSELEITDMDKSTVRGSLVIDISIPLYNSPYIQSFDIQGEGYIKQIIDRRDDTREELGENENSYEISGMIIKGTLRF